MSSRLPQIVVEIVSGDVYITHNLPDEPLVTLYDWDAADKIGFADAGRLNAEVSEGQKRVDDVHNEWAATQKEQEGPDYHNEVYDCTKDYLNDRDPWSD
jgi:hypothetical protein